MDVVGFRLREWLCRGWGGSFGNWAGVVGGWDGGCGGVSWCFAKLVAVKRRQRG